MPYSNFTRIEELRDQFGLTITSAAPLYAATPEVAATPLLADILKENIPLALNINTEKARSEFIIAPVLVEVRRLLDRQISLFSGMEFNVDDAHGLSGYCDFLLSDSPDQVFLTAPVACIVEAKNENIRSAYPQCIAEMVAAQRFNTSHGNPIPWLLGVVTTGSNWKFLQLKDQIVSIDFDEYLISQIGKILGIFVESLNAIGHPTAGKPVI
ncbi:MAG: hypothetical protein ETSY1_26110 [Candidatus Entotheonella factor]|uniref:Type I restriction enzyme R protein N-terminal domain-containing protein n=1 Tax=Entotheonella factor TaxID=1429438 RepID=W4LF67_ENTF1|nr:hypothetical protein [Candidatus Entotheonella palauensis]ETW96564.1 MAG: hypothetical protein ETSY1_26110 [Candidatus Entotheonella factor]